MQAALPFKPWSSGIRRGRSSVPERHPCPSDPPPPKSACPGGTEAPQAFHRTQRTASPTGDPRAPLPEWPWSRLAAPAFLPSARWLPRVLGTDRKLRPATRCRARRSRLRSRLPRSLRPWRASYRVAGQASQRRADRWPTSCTSRTSGPFVVARPGRPLPDRRNRTGRAIVYLAWKCLPPPHTPLPCLQEPPISTMEDRLLNCQFSIDPELAADRIVSTAAGIACILRRLYQN